MPAKVGEVVELLADGATLEVEFSDGNGQTYESIGLCPDKITVLQFEPTKPNAGEVLVATELRQDV